MTKDHTSDTAPGAGTINADQDTDRLAVTARAQAELIELLARLVLQQVEGSADGSDDG